MYIIVDTSSVNADPKLKNAEIDKLISKAKDQGYRVCFPRDLSLFNNYII